MFFWIFHRSVISFRLFVLRGRKGRSSICERMHPAIGIFLIYTVWEIISSVGTGPESTINLRHASGLRTFCEGHGLNAEKRTFRIDKKLPDPLPVSSDACLSISAIPSTPQGPDALITLPGHPTFALLNFAFIRKRSLCHNIFTSLTFVCLLQNYSDFHISCRWRFRQSSHLFRREGGPSAVREQTEAVNKARLHIFPGPCTVPLHDVSVVKPPLSDRKGHSVWRILPNKSLSFASGSPPGRHTSRT